MIRPRNRYRENESTPSDHSRERDDIRSETTSQAASVPLYCRVADSEPIVRTAERWSRYIFTSDRC